MKKYPQKKEIPFDSFHRDLEHPGARYGLPQEVVFCKKCVVSNQRPNTANEYKHTGETKKEVISFNEDGVCDACRYAEIKKDSINWEEREKQLKELCDKFRKSDGSYDCLVPGSGGKDSFYTAHVLKYKYGMHPLTVTWAPHMYTPWGWKNQQAWIHAGFDNYLCTPNGRVHRLLTRLAVENIFHPFQPFAYGQKVIGPSMALKYDIPLVFFAESGAEYGNPIKDNESAKRDWSHFAFSDKKDVYLAGTSLEALIQDFGVDMTDLMLYMPVDVQKLEDKGIETHFLGYYLPWHPQGAYYYAVEHGGFQAAPERTAGTYSKYNSIDDKMDDLHYYSHYIKFGIGRATYDASQEIRNGEITREEGLALVKKFDGEYPERFEKELFEYLSINEREFPVAFQMFEQPLVDREYYLHLADRFRSPHIWKFEHGAWALRHAAY
ncbi:MAG: N-acetyl sugar amidotransferase [Candidatus Yanofskybacteria bacterium]|nr:N-acetyl sugar amidotransferase [Candidatus Yanofskybacteria bacterium]